MEAVLLLGMRQTNPDRFVEEDCVPSSRKGRFIRLTTVGIDLSIESNHVEPRPLKHRYPNPLKKTDNV
mgnify:FL=1